CASEAGALASATTNSW
nr:immunoglobulin heavy chain junction region [Macaca mulatta]MOW95594.1 immunoglobulin heavy chain junction region [Macaca mulatta]MOW95595.1 immunoglobulin heavy chain junction region [Macaca mulatta]MOW96036.1 immunoglobulin heavy chain junction region [Macaca mulatta]MOW96906.1 immunoglobulin heavy chain junction region [Macaca mulatta]